MPLPLLFSAACAEQLVQQRSHNTSINTLDQWTNEAALCQRMHIQPTGLQTQPDASCWLHAMSRTDCACVLMLAEWCQSTAGREMEKLSAIVMHACSLDQRYWLMCMAKWADFGKDEAQHGPFTVLYMCSRI